MTDHSNNAGTHRPGTRPFVSARPVEDDNRSRTFSYAPPRPFSYTGASRRAAPQSVTSSMSVARAQSAPTPTWTVAVYEPGLEYAGSREREAKNPANDLVDASLALADDVREAQRHSSSLAAADSLEIIARRLRRGEILLLPGASVHSEAAVVSSVLAALLGGRR